MHNMSFAHFLSSINMSNTHLSFLRRNPCLKTFLIKTQQARSLNRILDIAHGDNAKWDRGSLYQFFLDKVAIGQALARRYGDLLGQRLTAENGMSLDAYVKLIINRSKNFLQNIRAIKPFSCRYKE